MFNSSLAKEMTAYIDLRISTFSVSSVYNDKRTLVLLDQYLVQTGFQGKNLTEDILSDWSKTLSGKSKTVKEKLGVVRGFGKYLNTLGYASFLPTLPKVKSDYIPYIFSDEEVTLIFHYADNMKPINPKSCSAYFQLKIPMALRILYSCGTRLQETMALQRKDIDFKNRTIFLKKAKFIKEGSFNETDGIPVIKVTGNIDLAEEVPVPEGNPDDTHPYIQKQMAEKLGISTQDLYALIWYFKMKESKKYHLEITVSKSGKTHKFSNFALEFLQEKLNELKGNDAEFEKIRMAYKNRNKQEERANG